MPVKPIHSEKAPRQPGAQRPQAHPTGERGSDARLTPLLLAMMERCQIDEAALAVSDARLRNLVTSMFDWVWEIDAQFNYTSCSSRVIEVLGYNPADLVGKRPTDFMQPAEAERIQRLFEEISQTQELILDLKSWHVCADGSLACVLSNAVPILDEDGRLVSYRGVSKDITEAQRAEERRERHLREQELLAQLSIGFLSLHDFDAKVNRALAAVGEFLETSRVWILRDQPARSGWQVLYEWCCPTAEPRIGAPARSAGPQYAAWKRMFTENEVSHSIDPDALPDGFLSALYLESARSFLAAPLWVQGRYFGSLGFEESRSQQMWDRSDVVLIRTLAGMLSTAFELCELEDARQEEASRLRMAAEVARLGTWEWNVPENRAVVGANWRSLMGFPEQDEASVWDFWVERIHPADRPQVLSAFYAHLESDQPFEVEYRWNHPQDGDLWLSTTGQVVAHGPDGKSQRMVGVTQDITTRKGIEQTLRQSLEELEEERLNALLLKDKADTQRRRAEEALAELDQSKKALIEAAEAAKAANQAKSVFLANVSHEIRTPMNAVIGLTHLALQSRMTPVQRDYILKIQSSAKTLLDIINEILDFSKIEAGKMELEQVPFDLNCVLEDVATMVNLWVKEKKVEAVFDIQPDLPFFLIGDPLRLEQVLINLLNNAVKFTSDGEVVFRTRLISDEANRVVFQFSIQDTGIGIEPEAIPQVFNAFLQADPSTTRVYGGTGLGLAICKRLVELMGGVIWVESTLGVGTTFHFTARFGKTIKEKELPLPGLDARPRRVLVVEDSPVSRAVFCNYLNRFEVQTVASGAEALQRLLEDPQEPLPDLLVLDNSLGSQNGIAVARRIRQELSASQLPVLLLSNAYEHEQAAAQSAGLDLAGVLVKPLTQPMLLNPVLQTLFGAGFDNNPAYCGDHLEQPWANRLQGARILLVEDNALNQEIAATLLRSAGAEVEIAHNGQVGVTLAKNHPFDAILMDIQMPIMDGYQAAAIIRQVLGLTEVPIIALTAHAMAGDRDRSLQAGMNDHINKPIDPEEVFAVLERWVRPKERKEAPPAAAPKPEPLFPALPGLDTVFGLKRVGGNAEVYRRLLLKFAETQSGLLAQARAVCAQGDPDQAAALVHNLKGTSGSLGADGLYSAVCDLEQAIRRPDPEALPVCFSRAELELRQVLNAIATLQNSGVQP